MKKFTIAYFSSRLEPKWDWFFWSLRRELNNAAELVEFDIVVIDYHAQFQMEKRAEKLNACMPAGRDWEVHLSAPKPTVWQGKHRLTKKNYFAASNARNTAFCLAKNSYVVCVDDVSVLMPGWLNNVLHAVHHNYVVLGAYRKMNELDCDKFGKVTHGKMESQDCRWEQGSDDGIRPINGDQLFGCSFGCPLEEAMEVNGFDEICDGQGAEDYDFGIRLQRTGLKFFYNRNMLTYESEELHFAKGNEHFTRDSKMTTFGGQQIMSDHVLLNRVRSEIQRKTTLAQYSNLREIRRVLEKGENFPIPAEPAYDWRDGTALSEM